MIKTQKTEKILTLIKEIKELEENLLSGNIKKEEQEIYLRKILKIGKTIEKENTENITNAQMLISAIRYCEQQANYYLNQII